MLQFANWLFLEPDNPSDAIIQMQEFMLFEREYRLSKLELQEELSSS